MRIFIADGINEYSYENREEFEKNVAATPNLEGEQSKFLEAGTNIKYNGKLYKIVSVNLKIWDSIQKPITTDGSDMSYNCDLNVRIEPLK